MKIDSGTMERLHKIQIEILDEFVKICKKHNLIHFLVGGTLLGAARHKGFIPWDDDIDVGMPREDFEKFIKICENELDAGYYIQAYNITDAYWRAYLIMYKKNTVLFNEDEFSFIEDDGIFIDIFPYDTTINFYPLQRMQYFLMKKTQNIIQMKIRIQKGEKKNILKRLLARLFSYKVLQMQQQKIIKLGNHFHSDHIISWAGEYGISRETHRKNVLFPTVEIIFEGKYYKAPREWNTFLSHVYGKDYMETPPIEKRKTFNPQVLIFDTTGRNNDENSNHSTG
ncbi:LPS cholinephosphotransferase [Spirochaetia bacterium]|nr:LPS cholinephosphotransferase [Spirochaetia bacterium]